jgi:hypothetical protein
MTGVPSPVVFGRPRRFFAIPRIDFAIELAVSLIQPPGKCPSEYRGAYPGNQAGRSGAGTHGATLTTES